MLQSHWRITDKRQYLEIEECLNERPKPAAPCRHAGIPASPPAEPDPPVYPEPPRTPEIPSAINDPAPDVVPVPVREPPATPGLVTRWLAGFYVAMPALRGDAEAFAGGWCVISHK